MEFHIYRQIIHENPGGPTYQQLGSTRFLEDAYAILARWHSGYIISDSGRMIVEKNLKGLEDETTQT